MAKTARKICFVTGTRAEYGLLFPLLKEVAVDKNLSMQLVVTGSHLSTEFGNTVSEIKADGFSVDREIPILSGDTPKAVCDAMAKATSGFSEAFSTLQPDIIVLLGDRYELLSAAAAATVLQIPLAHISGGEITMGAIDDAFRHSITKMSHLHFTSTEVYRKRVVQLGESPSRVFNVGALSVDNIKATKLSGKKELEEALGFRFAKKNILITYHPETISDLSPEKGFEELLASLDKLEDTLLIFTYPNADSHGAALIKRLEDYVDKNKRKAVKFRSLGRKNYLSMLRYVDVMVGNSSSGITEGPVMGIPAVNIGDRQAGRLIASSIINCKPSQAAISAAIRKAYGPAFRKDLQKMKHPYGDGKAAKKIREVLRSYVLEGIQKKRFHDLNR